MTLARFSLTIGGEFIARLDSLAEVWSVIDVRFGEEPGRYQTALALHLSDFGHPARSLPLRTYSEKLRGGIWDALCNSPDRFECFLSMAGWQAFSPAPPSARGGPDRPKGRTARTLRR